MWRMTRFTLLGAILLALMGAFIGAGHGWAVPSQSQLVIAVARFDDRSGSGLANVGEGVADLLTDKLVNAGYRVVERAEIESILLERGLNPLVMGDLAQAAQIVGADLLLIGSVSRVDIQETSVSLGFVTVSGATVTVGLSIRAVSVYTSEVMGATSVEAEAEGQIGLSINIGWLITPGWRTNVCTGGFRTDKSSYYQGEVINIGYLDPSPALPNQFNVWPSGPGLPLGFNLGPKSSSFPYPSCITWTWNPSPPLSPGTYTLNLYDNWGPPWDPLRATTTFTAMTGTAPPAWVSEITVGTEQFEGTIVGQAVDAALDELVGKIGNILLQIEPQILAQRAEAAQPEPEERLKGQVVQILEDGAIVIDLGRAEGVQKYDVFEVFDTVEILDPDTGELIEVIKATEVPKGEIIVGRVEERVSVADKIGQDFQAEIGDLVIRKEEA